MTEGLDGAWQNLVLPQDVQLNLPMPRLASDDQRNWPCLVLQVMTEGRDGTLQNLVLQQEAKLNLAIPCLAKND